MGVLKARSKACCLLYSTSF